MRRALLLSLLLLASCDGGDLTETTRSDLCPDLRITRTWADVDVSHAQSFDKDGARVAITAHAFTFMRQWNEAGSELLPEGTMTEIWELADGTVAQDAAPYLACNGQLTVRSEARPYTIAGDVMALDGRAFVAE